LGHRGGGEGVGHVGSALAEQVAPLAWAVPVALDQGCQRLGLLERREVLTLEVLDERDLQRVATLANHRRQAIQPRQLRRPEATLTGQQLVSPLGAPTHHDRLQQTPFEDRRPQLGELVPGEIPAWLLWIRLHGCERHYREHRALPPPNGCGDRQGASRPLGLGHLRPHTPPPPRPAPLLARSRSEPPPNVLLPRRPGAARPRPARLSITSCRRD